MAELDARAGLGEFTEEDLTAAVEEALAEGLLSEGIEPAPAPASNATGGATAHVSSYKAKQLIVMRRDLKMRKGKIAAQAGHACVEAVLMALEREGRLAEVHVRKDEDGNPYWIELDDSGTPATALSDWFRWGVAKVCVYVDSEEALLDIAAQGREQGFVVALVRDSGLTEFHGEATYTCLAFEPLRAADIDPITGSLPLY